MIARRPQVAWWASLVLALGFAVVALPVVTADRWLPDLLGGRIVGGGAAVTVRVPAFSVIDTPEKLAAAKVIAELLGATRSDVEAARIGGGGGVVIARGEVASRDDAAKIAALAAVTPTGPVAYLIVFGIVAVAAWIFSRRARRSIAGRLVRVQVVNLVMIALLAAIVKLAMLGTPANVLLVPVAVFALIPTLVLDRITGLATGVLAAVIVALCVPFDLGVAVLLLVQVATAALVVGERPKHRLRALVGAGLAATLLAAIAYPVLQYLATGTVPISDLREPLRSAWVAAVAGPAIATAIAAVLVPIYQVLVGEITRGALGRLEDLSHPLLKQIAERAPGTWQASLMTANMAEIAANAIGADGRLARVGAYYHDLGKALQPKYFVENLEPGETSPHDKLVAEASASAIFAHVTDGVTAARKGGLHPRIVDFVHMHHGDSVLEYFWAKCQAEGNPKGLTIERFRYPGEPPQTRETAILAICDAVEAASRTIKKAEPQVIDALVQSIVYGKLQRGQLAASGLSVAELRTLTASLSETIRHANHGRSDAPVIHAEHSASAMPAATTAPRLDALDRAPKAEAIRAAKIVDDDNDDDNDVASAATEGLNATPKLRRPEPVRAPLDNELANSSTAPLQLPLVDRKPEPVPEPKPEADVDADRSSRDSRRDADRLAMASRYANDPPASRDSGNHTTTFQRDGQDDTAEPAVRPSDSPASNPLSSRDGSRRVSHSAPSDGDDAHDGGRARANKRTNDTGARNRAPGDFVAQMVLQPTETKPAIPTGTGPPGNSLATKDSTREIEQFATDAERALVAAAPDLIVTPAARKRAATLPPTPDLLRPPTIQPPNRRPGTIPPANRDAARDADAERERNIGKTLFGAAAELRPPAATRATLPSIPRGSDVDASRDDAKREHDDAATTNPSMAAVKPSDLEIVDEFQRTRADAAVTKPIPRQDPDSASTRPTMPRATDDGPESTESESGRADDTQPALEMPLRAPRSDPAIDLDRLATPPPPSADKRIDRSDRRESAADRQNTWARGLAARIDANLDDEFAVDTPTRPPSRAELQALSDAPVDATRLQSYEEIEKLHRDPALRRSEPELDFNRRAFPTAEVREEDIEAAIEIAPSARRTGAIPLAVAKKKPPSE